MKLQTVRIATPIGDLVAYSRLHALYALAFFGEKTEPRRELDRRLGAFSLEDGDPLDLRAALAAYFAGRLGALDSIAVECGGTPFQRSVWMALRRIPAGRTASYADLARHIGRPRAVRPVGAANARNPVVLVVPCHRVICSDGALGGYGAGLDRKRWLLQHEGVLLPLA